MVKKALVMTWAVCVLLAGTVLADAYNDAATGDWDAGDTWATSPSFPVTGDDVVIDSHRVTAGHDVGGSPYIIPDVNSLTIQDGGELYLKGSDSTQTVDVTLEGGQITTHREYVIDNVKTLAGNITVASGAWSHSTIEAAVREDLDISGNLLGSGELRLAGGLLQGDLRLSGDNSGFTGSLVLADDNESDPTRYYDLRLQSADAFAFSGTVTIHGLLQPEVAPTPGVQPTILIGENGLYNLKDREGVSFVDTDWDMTFDGGTFKDDNVAHGGSWEHSGAIALAAGGATFQMGYANITLSGTITGTGKLTLLSGNRDWFAVSNPNNTHNGGTDVKLSGNDALRVLADGALGDGTATVYGGAVLRTEPATPATDAAISNVPVVVQSGGTLQVNSTETAANVTIEAGGILQDVSDTTVFDYDNNFHIQAGAIFSYDEVPEDLPAVAQIAPDGEGQRYVYKGDSGNFASGDYTVGTGTSVRGLAAIGAVTMYSDVKVHEATAGGGFDLFAPAGNSIALRGVELDGTGAVKLAGDGDFQMARYNDPDNTPCITGTVTTINKHGSGRIWFNNPGCVNGDHTINVHAGYVDFGRYSSGYSDALGTSTDPADWARLNVKAGAFFYSEYTGGIQLSRGKITIESGAAAWDNEGFDDGAQWTFQSGSQIIVGAGHVTAASVVSTGNPSFVFLRNNDYNHWQLGDSAGNVDVVLSAGNRITTNVSTGMTAASGDLVLAGGATEGLVTARNGTALYVYNRVDMPAGTLVIGADGTYRVHTGWRTDTPYDKWEDITQAGDVRLFNAANDIGLIDVRYGRLVVSSNGPINDTTVNLCSTGGGVTSTGALDTTDTTFTGDGTISAADNANWVYLRGGSLAPDGGASAGTLNVYGRGVYLEQGGSSNNVQIALDVVSGGGENPPAAGTNYDALTSVRIVGGTANADLTVQLPVPSVNLIPDELAGDTLTVVTQNSGGLSFLTDPFASASLVTVNDPGNHWTGNINYTALTVTVTDLAWTGHAGDATLDDKVTYIDLGILATNYGTTGAVWTDADFTLDGAVSYLDLGILATNYGWEAGGAGGSVPEPVTAVLLALGAVAMVRRVRRK